MTWNIVTDSSCDLPPSQSEDGEIRLSSVPFIISVGSADFVDDEVLDVPAMLEAMEKEPAASHTSCPSPQAWLSEFERADNVIALTISSQLSGSMNSALIAKELAQEQHPEKRIAVVDSRSTGPEITLCAEELKDMIAAGAEFDQAVAHAEEFFPRTRIAFALSSFDNLVKNGRMSRIKGFLARALGMWGIGIGSDEGEILFRGKTRGKAGALEALLADMRERGYQGGRAAISHCLNQELAQALADRIRALWKGAEVSILPTRGLCSYYAERGGLIVSY